MIASNSRFFLIPFIMFVALFLVAGCGEKEKETTSGLEVEMFAKAQDLQKKEQYEEAITVYRDLIKRFPETKQCANSQFMIGYIYANHIKDFDKAREEFNTFLEDYKEVSEPGLIEGAKFELENLGKDIDEIPILSGLGKENEAAADETPVDTSSSQ